MSDDENVTDSLKLVGDYLEIFDQSLNKQINASGYTLNSKLPWKADSLRELLLHRITDIANSAMVLYQSSHRVAAVLLVRGLMETTAMAYSLQKRTLQFLRDWDEDDYDQFLMKALMGSRDGTTELDSINGLTVIDSLDKEYEGYRAMYDGLCEYAHPNWRGLMLSYSVIDRANYTTHLGPRADHPEDAVILGPFVGALSIFDDIYNCTGDTLQQINNHYEES